MMGKIEEAQMYLTRAIENLQGDTIDKMLIKRANMDFRLTDLEVPDINIPINMKKFNFYLSRKQHPDIYEMCKKH